MAQFDFFLNKQGVRGPQGIQGEQGFSPIITVATNTLSEYVLQIQTQNNTFLTANLREHKDDLGGTYIRYNRETGVMYAGDADVASESQMGVVRFATATDIEREDDSSVVSPANVADMIAAIDPSGDITNLQNRVTTLEGETESLEGSVSANSLAISELQSNVSGLLANYVPKTRTINGYALSSNITLAASDVNAYSKSETDVLLADKADVSDLPDMNNYYNTTQIDLLLNEKADISDIPAVGNGVITINQGGVQKGQFSVNQSGDVTINLTDGGGGSGSYVAGNGIDITNDIISIDSSVVALQTDLPTATSDLTNDSGFITSADLPTVGNGTITFTQGGVTKGTITTNQSGDSTIALDAGGSQYILPPATTSTLGGVIVDGTTITIDNNGVISSSGSGSSYTAGTGIDITNDVISIDDTVVASKDDLDNKIDKSDVVPPIAYSELVQTNSDVNISGSTYTLTLPSGTTYSSRGYSEYSGGYSFNYPCNAGANTLSQEQLSYISDNLVGKTIYHGNGDPASQGYGYPNIVLGKLSSNRTFTPKIWVGGFGNGTQCRSYMYLLPDTATSSSYSSPKQNKVYSSVLKEVGLMTTQQYCGPNIQVRANILSVNGTIHIYGYFTYYGNTYSGDLNTGIPEANFDLNCALLTYTGQSSSTYQLANTKVVDNASSQTIWQAGDVCSIRELGLNIGTGLAVQNGSLVNTVDVSNKVTGTGITNMVKLTEAQYEALATKDATTFYVIVAASS